jgi:hypothetical protein
MMEGWVEFPTDVGWAHMYGRILYLAPEFAVSLSDSELLL